MHIITNSFQGLFDVFIQSMVIYSVLFSLILSIGTFIFTRFVFFVFHFFQRLSFYINKKLINIDSENLPFIGISVKAVRAASLMLALCIFFFSLPLHLLIQRDIIADSTILNAVIVVTGTIAIGVINVILLVTRNIDQNVKERTLSRASDMADGDLLREHRYNIYRRYGPVSRISPCEYEGMRKAFENFERSSNADSIVGDDFKPQYYTPGRIPRLRSIIAILNRWDQIGWEIQTHNLHEPLARRFMYETFAKDMRLIRDIAQKLIVDEKHWTFEGNDVFGYWCKLRNVNWLMRHARLHKSKQKNPKAPDAPIPLLTID